MPRMLSRSNRAAIKSGPPRAFIEGVESSSEEESDDALPQSNGDTNNGQDDPSRQLLRESRINAETEAPPASSPVRSVHFSDLREEDADGVDQQAKESAYLLRSSKSQPQSDTSTASQRVATGKLKKPSIKLSNGRNGKVDDPRRPSVGQRSRAATRSQPKDDQRPARQTRAQSRETETSITPSNSNKRPFRLGDVPEEPNTARSPGSNWSIEDDNTLKVLRDAKVPWQDLTQVDPLRTSLNSPTDGSQVFPGRTKFAIIGRTGKAGYLRTLTVPAAERLRVLQKYANLIPEVEQQSSRAGSQTATPKASQKRAREQVDAQDSSNGRFIKRLRSRAAATEKDEDRVGNTLARKSPQVLIDKPKRDRHRPPRAASQVATKKPGVGPSRRTTAAAEAEEEVEDIEEGDEAENEEYEEASEEDATLATKAASHDWRNTQGTQVSLTIDRLYRQQAKLAQIFSAIKDFKKERVGVYDADYREQTEIRAVKTISKKCEELAAKYAKLEASLRHDQQSAIGEEEVEHELPDLHQEVSVINPGDMIGQENGVEKATQIYVYIFTGLVVLLEHASRYYSAACDYEDPPSKNVGLAALSALIEIASAVETFDRQPKNWTSHPQTGIVRKLHNGVVAPIKQVLIAWRREAKDLRERLRKEEAARQHAEIRRRQDEEEEREGQAEAERRLKIDRLRKLYLARFQMEPDVRLRMKYHRMPKLSRRRPEIDANGEEFERVPVFAARSPSSHPPHVPGLGEVEWQPDETAALSVGLQRFNRDHVWLQIIRRYCGPYMPLRRRNVIDLLKRAKYMRQIWMDADAARGVETEQWIRDIPDLDLLDLL